MSKEMQLLKSKIDFYKKLINHLNYLNYVTKSNKYNEKIIDYRKILDTLDNALNDLSSEDFDILIQRVQEYIDDLI